MPRKERVTRVIDGDTFKTADRRRKHPVRLANVDAPEMGQRGAAAAKAALNKLIKDKEVTIDTQARDRYGRSVAKVKAGRRSVNQAMRKRNKKK